MTKTIIFPMLRKELYKTPTSQLMQIMEELGELSERIGQLTKLTGKRKETPENIKELVAEEAMDVAQAAVGVVFSIGVDIMQVQNDHWAKMDERKYLDYREEN